MPFKIHSDLSIIKKEIIDTHNRGYSIYNFNDTSEPINGADGTGKLYKKLGDDGIFWKPDSGGSEIDITASGGEVNTGSNVGSGGVSVYKQKVGTDLQFNSINVGSNKLSVTYDSGNNEVDLDLNEANIDLDNILEGNTNLYFNGKTTDDLPTGSTNKFMTLAEEAMLAAIVSTGSIDDYQYTLVSSATHTALVSEYILLVNYTNTGPCTITLPAISTLTNNKKKYQIVDNAGNAGTNNITIARGGTDTIMNDTSAVIDNNNNSFTIISDSISNWLII